VPIYIIIERRKGNGSSFSILLQIEGRNA
jgi:hypothetical protein